MFGKVFYRKKKLTELRFQISYYKWHGPLKGTLRVGFCGLVKKLAARMTK